MHTLPGDAMLVARMLSGSWRAAPPPCDLSPAQIDRVTPLLTMSGGTALGWWRVKGTTLAAHADTLRGSAQLLALDEMAKDAALSTLCGLLNGAGVTPMLFKGWAVARAYPEGWLRPYGDFDLIVRECDFARAHAALTISATRFHGNDFAMPFGPRGHCSVDLHQRLDAFYDADVETIFSRARAVSLPKGSLLVPSPEDHLRLCAIHMFRHGAWRPLWLCDVAAMSEAAGADFDWDICLGNRPATAAWTAAALTLAHRLLGAQCDHLPLRVRNQCVPDWLEDTVLRYWSYPHAGQITMSGDVTLRDPLAKLRWHWPDAIKATIWSGGLPVPGSRLPWKLRRGMATIGQAIKRKFRPS